MCEKVMAASETEEEETRDCLIEYSVGWMGWGGGPGTPSEANRRRLFFSKCLRISAERKRDVEFPSNCTFVPPLPHVEPQPHSVTVLAQELCMWLPLCLYSEVSLSLPPLALESLVHGLSCGVERESCSNSILFPLANISLRFTSPTQSL